MLRGARTPLWDVNHQHRGGYTDCDNDLRTGVTIGGRSCRLDARDHIANGLQKSERNTALGILSENGGHSNVERSRATSEGWAGSV